MKRKWFFGYCTQKIPRRKILRVMRLCVIFMFMAVCQLSATTLGQTIQLKYSSSTLKMIFEEVEKQTGKITLFSNNELEMNRKVKLETGICTLEDLYRKVLVGTDLEFEVGNEYVVIRKRTEGIQTTRQSAERVLKGHIMDEDKNPLPGVTIMIEGTHLGCSTDVNGDYSLMIPDKNAKLIFSCVGMKNQEITVTNQEILNVIMRASAEDLEEVVVTGYSTRKVSEMTGSAQQFRGKVLAENASNGDILGALKGHTAGLQITGSEGNPARNNSLLLRGLGTLYQGKQSPLIVIDGIVTDYTNLNSVVSVNDIEELTVLRDAASTSVYGSRAATGVIVVTTKKGNKNRSAVTVDMKFGLSDQNLGDLKYMTSKELLEYGKMGLTNWWNNNAKLQKKYPDREVFLRDTLGTLYRNFDVNRSTDWQDYQYQLGVTKSIGASISGGGDRMRYYLSYNYFDEKGTKINNNLTRNFLKARMDYDVTSFLSIGVNLSGTFSKYTSPNSGSMEDYHPWLSPYDKNGKLRTSVPYWRAFTLYKTNKINPLLDNQYNNSITNNDNLIGSFSGTLRPFEWMTLTSVNTYTRACSNTNDYQDSQTYSGNYNSNNYSNGILNLTDSREQSFLTSNILRLQHYFGQHNLSGLIGQEFYEKHLRNSDISMYDQSVVGERNVGGFSKVGKKIQPSYVPGGNEYESGSFSVFAEANYNYSGKYMASASFRTDASTNFGKDNRYGKFYSVSGAWLISSEDFMQQQKLFSLLKLRLSYGTSGKEAGIDYLNYTLYAVGNDYEDYYREHPNNPSSYPAVIEQLGNDKLTWETAYTLNLGLDMGLWKDRIRLNMDFYRRLNSDLIMSVATPSAIGVGAQFRNVGEMLNKGIEFTLYTHTVKSEAFNWYTNFTFSYNKNELTHLYDGHFVNTDGRTFNEGDNIDELKKVKVTGVDPENGKPIYEKINEDGCFEYVNTLTAATAGNGELSYQNIGLGRAPYYGGFTNTFDYKNFELYVHMSYSLGYKAYSNLKSSYTDGRAWLMGNLYSVPSNLKIWQQAGDKADIPMVNSDPAYTQNLYNTTSFGYMNAGHLRISQIRLSYRLPAQWLQPIRMQAVALSFACDNVCVITSRNFVGADPENMSGWAAPRRYVFGLNFTF